jgi:hypothetical protein
VSVICNVHARKDLCRTTNLQRRKDGLVHEAEQLLRHKGDIPVRQESIVVVLMLN